MAAARTAAERPPHDPVHRQLPCLEFLRIGALPPHRELVTLSAPGLDEPIHHGFVVVADGDLVWRSAAVLFGVGRSRRGASGSLLGADPIDGASGQPGGEAPRKPLGLTTRAGVVGRW